MSERGSPHGRSSGCLPGLRFESPVLHFPSLLHRPRGQQWPRDYSRSACDYRAFAWSSALGRLSGRNDNEMSVIPIGKRTPTSLRFGWKGGLSVEGRFLSYSADATDPVFVDGFIVVPGLLLLGFFRDRNACTSPCSTGGSGDGVVSTDASGRRGGGDGRGRERMGDLGGHGRWCRRRDQTTHSVTQHSKCLLTTDK